MEVLYDPIQSPTPFPGGMASTDYGMPEQWDDWPYMVWTARNLSQFILQRSKETPEKTCDIPYVSNKKPYALDLTSQKQEAVRIDIYPDTIPDAAAPAPQVISAPHIDNSHTIELMIGDVSLKVSNSADPVLVQQIVRMLHPALC